MSADISQVVIMNLALAHINKRAVTSPTEASEEARKCSLFYHQARRAALRACDWNFATQNVALTLLGSVGDASFDPTWATPQDVVPGYSYLYGQPSKCLRVRRIYNPQVLGYQGNAGPYFDGSGNPVESVPGSLYNQSARNNRIKYEVLRSPKTNQMAIATDLVKAWCCYTFDVVDESQFDDMFVDAFGFQLALLICPSLTADDSLLQIIAAQFKEFVGEAKRKNGGEGTEELPRSSAYEDARQ